MKSIAIFNNKGGVGKTTLTYHVAYALAELGQRTLLVDLDPQSNLTLFALTEDQLGAIWNEEEPFIEDYAAAVQATSPQNLSTLTAAPRSVHFILKPAEDGASEPAAPSTPIQVHQNLGIIPGRLTVHMFEERLASRWSEAYRGDPFALRVVTRIRKLCEEYAANRQYELVIIDTSPSLGILNKVIISTVDGVLVPCMPDMFSLYGIRNIGRALGVWQKDFERLLSLLNPAKRAGFPEHFVRFLGFTIYKAKKYSNRSNSWDLAQAHYNFAQQIPQTIRDYVPPETYKHLDDSLLALPIGETAVMHDHMTMANMAQKYKRPIWLVPDADNLDDEDRNTISGNSGRYRATRDGYRAFAVALLGRVATL